MFSPIIFGTGKRRREISSWILTVKHTPHFAFCIISFDCVFPFLKLFENVCESIRWSSIFIDYQRLVVELKKRFVYTNETLFMFITSFIHKKRHVGHIVDNMAHLSDSSRLRWAKDTQISKKIWIPALQDGQNEQLDHQYNIQHLNLIYLLYYIQYNFKQKQLMIKNVKADKYSVAILVSLSLCHWAIYMYKSRESYGRLLSKRGKQVARTSQQLNAWSIH